MDEEQKQHLLHDDETSDHEQDNPSPHKAIQLSKPKAFLFLILLLISIVINAFLISLSFIKPKSNYSSHNVGLRQDVVESQRWHYTAYSHPNETYRTEAWDSIDIDRTIVALDHEEAVALGLPSTAKFPWDHTKDIYAVSVFHQLHCMKLLYRSLEEAHHGQPFTNGYSHILHCLDSIRGDLKCMADDHLWSVSEGYNPPIGEGQMMRCRDFNRLDEWAREHHSCFKYSYVSDTLPSTMLHQFRNCPDDSPYMMKMREHFGYSENWVPEFTMNHGPEFPDGNEDRVEWNHA